MESEDSDSDTCRLLAGVVVFVVPVDAEHVEDVHVARPRLDLLVRGSEVGRDGAADHHLRLFFFGRRVVRLRLEPEPLAGGLANDQVHNVHQGQLAGSRTATTPRSWPAD